VDLKTAEVPQVVFTFYQECAMNLRLSSRFVAWLFLALLVPCRAASQSITCPAVPEPGDTAFPSNVAIPSNTFSLCSSSSQCSVSPSCIKQREFPTVTIQNSQFNGFSDYNFFFRALDNFVAHFAAVDDTYTWIQPDIGFGPCPPHCFVIPKGSTAVIIFQIGFSQGPFPITLRNSSGIERVAGSINITFCCPADAAALAKSLLTAPYGYGGKGYDFSSTMSYVDGQTIFDGYTYNKANCSDKTKVTLAFDKGVDCSGLVMWSYNTARGATTQFLDKNPIRYPNADGQFQNNTIGVGESGLQPGDLLFFDFEQDGQMDHVAMYVGGDDVVEARGGLNCDIPVILSKKSDLKTKPGFAGFSRVTTPQVGIRFLTGSPVSLDVTDPDGFQITNNTVTFTEREILREVPRTLYYSQDTNLNDTVLAPSLKLGDYVVKVVPKPGVLPTDTYSLYVETAGSIINLAQNARISDIPILGYGITSAGGTIIPFIPVAIDIKPGGFPNAIKLTSKSTIPVAILSSSTFSAPTGVDKTSLTFGRTGNAPSLAFCDSTGEDVNRDGLLDLVCHFYTQKTGFQIADTKGVLRGRTVGGQLIKGADSVQIVP